MTPSTLQCLNTIPYSMKTRLQLGSISNAEPTRSRMLKMLLNNAKPTRGLPNPSDFCSATKSHVDS
jgi:hypothetical protein